MRHTPWTQASDFAIGLKPIPLERWFEGNEDDGAISGRKLAVMAEARDHAWGETAGSRAAQLEACRMVSAATGRVAPESPGGPLFAAACLVSDDLCLMERRDGGWTLTAASLCAPTFFSAAEVVGRSLGELHGPVPGFETRLLNRVTRIFDNLAPGVVLERRNWTLLNSAELFLPDAAPVRARLAALTADDAGTALHLRVERQTLRRLPRTGAALFTIRVWRWPLDALTTTAGRTEAFAAAWRSAAPAFRAYKRLDLYDALVEGWLSERGL